MDQRVRVGKASGLEQIVVVGDDQVRARGAGCGRGTNRGNAAIHRNHDACAGGGELSHRFGIEPVALVQTVRHIGAEAALGRQRPQCVKENRGGAHPVDVVVTINHDGFTGASGGENPVRGTLDPGEQRRVVQLAQCWRKKVGGIGGADPPCPQHPFHESFARGALAVFRKPAAPARAQASRRIFGATRDAFLALVQSLGHPCPAENGSSVRHMGSVPVVKLNKIYTRTGDDGTTGLATGDRVPKDAVRVDAYGTVDEANAFLGAAIVQCAHEGRERVIGQVLTAIQQDLFDLGADLATPVMPDEPAGSRLRVVSAQTERLERTIDEYNDRLAPLNSFVLPGGRALAAALHVARTVVRRAERLAVQLQRAEPEQTNPEAVKYLNRLSDLLFVLARVANDDGAADVLWVPGVNRPK